MLVHKPPINLTTTGFAIGPQIPVRIILHDTESHDYAGIRDIDGIIQYWRDNPFSDGTRLGAHFIVDAEGKIAQCGRAREELQHVGGLNGASIGIEQIGFARFTPPIWLARIRQLNSVVHLLAYLHQRHGIPLDVPTHQGPGLLMRGVMTHAMVSKFEPASQGHSDPGIGYPLGTVLYRARRMVRGEAP